MTNEELTEKLRNDLNLLLGEVIEIKSTQQRILGHHEKFDAHFDTLYSKDEQRREDLHKEALLRKDGDEAVKDQFRKEHGKLMFWLFTGAIAFIGDVIMRIRDIVK